MNALRWLPLLLLPLISFAENHGNAKAEILVQSDVSWDGQKLPPYPTVPPEITVLKVTIPPHSTLQWHKHPSINAGYMISGELTVIAEDNQSLSLKTGDALIELVDTWHFGRNDGDLPVEIVVFYVGAKDVPLAIIKPDSE
jgi:quercetin dioxygenase-like cupin family protein